MKRLARPAWTLVLFACAVPRGTLMAGEIQIEHDPGGSIAGTAPPDKPLTYGLKITAPWRNGGHFILNIPEHLEYRDGGASILRWSDNRGSINVTNPWRISRDGREAVLEIESPHSRGIWVLGSVKVAGPDRLSLSMKIVNRTRTRVSQIRPLYCAHYRLLEGFPRWETGFPHTYVLMAGRWTRLSEIHTKSDETNVKWARVKGTQFKPNEFVTSRGGAIRKPLDAAVAVVTDLKGKRKLAIGWKPGGTMLSNTGIPCLHADPRYEDIPPGGSREAQGLVIFTEGPLEAILAEFEKEGYLGGAKGRNGSYLWDVGSPADLDRKSPAHFATSDRIGAAGREGGISYRKLKPNVYQCRWIMPAFDFHPDDHGAVRHVFYLTVRFKDIAKSAIRVHAGKGGEGFWGSGYVGSFGGAGDGEWKEETVVIRRSMMRSVDAKTFTFSLNNVTAAVPVDRMLLFSADAVGLSDKTRLIREAHELEEARRNALRTRLLRGSRDLGLPDPGPAPGYTAEERRRGFRAFFPPINRQLFSNSQPHEGELADSLLVRACPGEFESVLVAVRGLRELGRVTVALSDLKRGAKLIPASRTPWRWAEYSEQRIGSSWGKSYRVVPERLILGSSHEVGPERLEIACLTLKIPDDAPPGDYSATLAIQAERGGEASFPVKLTVHPFKLEHPEHATHGMFYYISYGNYSPFELQDMRDHGMDTVVAGLYPPFSAAAVGTLKIDAEPIKRAFEAFRELGYRAPLICNTGGLNSLLGKQANRRKYASLVKATLEAARAAGFKDIGFFPVDEPHTDPHIAKAKAACTWTKGVPGAKTYITTNPKASRVLDPVLDYYCYNLIHINPETVARTRRSGDTLMFYCPGFDVNPELNRFRAGFYLFRSGAKAVQFFAYFVTEGDPFVDLDGKNRDWNVVYPSMDSPYHDPTPEWEALREGVDDYCYAHTLKAAAARARRAGKAAEAKKALGVLNGVLAAVDPDGRKAGGPALAIEADVRLKDTKLDPRELKRMRSQMSAGWYDESRRKIAEAIIRLRRAMGE